MGYKIPRNTGSSDRRDLDIGSYSVARLNSCCDRLWQQTFVPLRTCLFIDGLDEYDGNQEDLLEQLSYGLHQVISKPVSQVAHGLFSNTDLGMRPA
jgi:hypothetical protein